MMWVLPKNYQLSSAFAVATLESKEDLILLESDIESSLMWRSKPSPLRTWSQRWNRVSWIPHLFTRTLKPSQDIYFEEQLTLSLADTRVSRFQRRAKDLEKKTQDTSGLTSESISEQYNLLESSSKMSKDTSRWDSPASSATWKKMVIDQRGEYSQRVKLGLLTKESESISWPTVRVSSSNVASQKELAQGNPKRRLETEVLLWPTPSACDTDGGIAMDVKRNGKRFYRENKDGVKWGVKLRDAVNAEEIWATPNTMDHLPQRSEEALRRQAQTTRKGRSRPANLREQVNPTAVRDYKGAVLPETLSAKNRNPMTNSLPDAIQHKSGRGHLNPEWVEWLMGVPIGLTELGSWGTE